MDSIPQSAYVFGMLFLAFVVYITAKGELPTYLTLLTGSGQSDAAKSASGGPASGTSLAAMTGQATAGVQGQGLFAGQTLGPDLTLFGFHTGIGGK